MTTARENSVVSRSIKDGQVKNLDVHDGAIDASKVAADSLTGQQIDESTLVGTHDGRLQTLHATVPMGANPGDGNSATAFSIAPGVTFDAVFDGYAVKTS